MPVKKNKTGRPVSKWTPEYLKKVERMIINYTDKTKLPILAEFAFQNDFIREQLYKYPELSYAIKRLLAKKEVQLEKIGLAKNNSMAIFSLKQLGWRDSEIKNDNSGLTNDEIANLKKVAKRQAEENV